MSRSLARDLIRAAAVAGLYFLAGKAGLSLAFVNASATAVWPPAGIALAALLVFGFRMWPAIFVGAFLVNAATAGNAVTALAIALGNTLEGLAGAYLVRRFAGGTRVFEHPQRIFQFAVLAGMVATTVSPAIGVTSLALAGYVPWPEFGPVWLTWWLGDAAGALVVAPFLILWSLRPRVAWSAGRITEAALLFACLLVVGGLAFGWAPPFLSGRPIEFLCVPVLVWAAFRFSQREAATATVLLSGIAVLGTLRGGGPFARTDPGESLLLLQSYMAVITILVLAVTSALAERRRSEARIRDMNDELELRVNQRTQELQRVVADLRREMAERARTQEALAASEARLREAQQVARVGSWEWDVERNTLWWSDEMCAIYGFPPGAAPVTYELYVERIHPDDRAYVRRVVEAAYRNKQPFQMEHRIIRPDGSQAFLHGRGRVVNDESGRPVRMQGSGQDITDEKRAEEERSHLLLEREARRQAEESNRLKDEFLATLSHELRTPLNAIVGWASLLRDGNLDPATTARAVETISRNAQVQSHLISDILDISRMIAGQLDFKLQMVHVTSVIEGALDTMKPAAQASGVLLESRLDGAGAAVLGSPERLQQVVWNLLSNAIKFTPKGKHVRISLTELDGSARIEVEDEGIGIDPDFLPHVFERFRQKNPSSSRKHGGLGLGLAIARHIVEYHGGTIAAANRSEGPGAVFTVSLPIASVAQGPAGPPVPPGPPGPQGTQGMEKGVAEPRRSPTAAAVGDVVPIGLPAHPLTGVQALLVEDEPDSRELLATLLTGCGAEVTVASSAAEALTLLGRGRPNLLISDIAMPGETGYDLIERIRLLAPEAGGAIPAIAVTAYSSPEDARRALRAGYHAHLAKPVQLRELVRLVSELVPEAGSEPERLQASRPA